MVDKSEIAFPDKQLSVRILKEYHERVMVMA